MNFKRFTTVATVTLSLLMLSDSAFAQKFTDVNPNSHIYHNEIDEFSELGIVNGYGNGKFGPSDKMRRSHASKVIMEALEETPIHNQLKKGKSKFKDVPTTSEFYNYISLMQANGIVSGYEDGTFKPNENVTKAQLVKMIVEAFDIPKDSTKNNRYSDVKKTNWNYSYINAAHNAGIITEGYTDKFNPNQKATREELVVFTSRALDWHNKKGIPIEQTIFKNNKVDLNSKTTKAPNSYKLLIEGIDKRSEFIPYDKSEIKNLDELKQFVLDSIQNEDITSAYPIKRFYMYSDGRIKFDYHFSEDEMARRNNAVEKKANQVLKKIIKPTYNDYDKVKAIHDYIVLNTDYDSDVYNGRKNDPTSYTIYGALINGLAVCDGYARTMSYLLDKVGIENYYVTGPVFRTGELHAWNMVKIEDKYYYLDSTYNDPITKPYKKDYIRYDYFLTDASTMAKDRAWNVEILPSANSKKFLIRK